MYKLIVLPKVKGDIKKVAKWYNKRQKGLGKRFTSEVREARKYIHHNPLKVQIRYDEIRMFKVKIFPYCLHFKVDVQRKIITLAAIFGTKENPEKWKEQS